MGVELEVDPQPFQLKRMRMRNILETHLTTNSWTVRGF